MQRNSISNTMATITLSLSAKADKTTGKSEILIRFVVGSRINQRGKSNIFIEASHWNAKEQRIIIPKFRLMNDEQKQLVTELTAADKQLANLKERIMQAFNEVGAGKVGLAKEWLKSVINEFNNFPTAAAEEAIRIMAGEFPDMLVGAGTVLTTEQVDRAVNAGAKFIVSPGLNPEVVKYCVSKNIPVTPGCANPSDVEQARKPLSRPRKPKERRLAEPTLTSWKPCR